MKTSKKRNLIAKDMRTSGLYRPKVEASRKKYERNQKHKSRTNSYDHS